MTKKIQYTLVVKDGKEEIGPFNNLFDVFEEVAAYLVSDHNYNKILSESFTKFEQDMITFISVGKTDLQLEPVYYIRISVVETPEVSEVSEISETEKVKDAVVCKAKKV